MTGSIEAPDFAPRHLRRYVDICGLIIFRVANPNHHHHQTEDGRKDPRVVVESEDQPERLLLETKIQKEDGFQKQQGITH